MKKINNLNNNIIKVIKFDNFIKKKINFNQFL